MNRLRRLRDLLVSLFSSQEIERFALYEFGPDVAYSLPRGSLVEVAFAFSQQLDRHGYVNASCFTSSSALDRAAEATSKPSWSLFRTEAETPEFERRTTPSRRRPQHQKTTRARRGSSCCSRPTLSLGPTFTGPRSPRDPPVEGAKGV